jgi:hypothetical protein
VEYPRGSDGFAGRGRLRRDDFSDEATDEGAAMAELVHDVAPGAAIAFHTAFGGGQAKFAKGMTDLGTTAGSTIMVDDVFFFAEPMYQDGIIAQAAAACVSKGIPYFSSAGNEANRGLRQLYTDIVPDTDDAGQPPTGMDLHDWGGGDGYLDVTLSPGSSFTAVLQWNQPFQSVNTAAGVQIDMDLYITPTASVAGLADPVASSIAVQGTTGNPLGDAVEIAGARLDDTAPLPVTVYVAVDHFDGNQDTIPLTARGGPLTIQFDTSGAYAPRTSFEPDLSGVNGNNTTFFGQALLSLDGFEGEPDTFPNFFGTSAAVPNVAAIAALMRQHLGLRTPREIESALQRTAVDITGSRAAIGRDDVTGRGLVAAVAALTALSETLPARHSIQSATFPNRYIEHRDAMGYLEFIAADSTDGNKRDATFTLVPGLGDVRCLSFQSVNVPTQYLRHSMFRIMLNESDGSEGFKQDATFCRTPGLGDATATSFESLNFPGHFIHNRSFELWLDAAEATEQFRLEATFHIVTPWVPPES